MADPRPIDRGVDEQAGGDRWLDWPCCPNCSKRRHTFCPTCDLAGDDFPLAEYIPASEPIGGPDPSSPRADTVAHPSAGCCGGAPCGGGASSSNSGHSNGHPTAAATGETGASHPANTPEVLPILLFCPACSEAFSPVFFRLCAQCGHDFGEGREVESPRQHEMNNRVLLALLVLAGLAVGLLAYFWVLFR